MEHEVPSLEQSQKKLNSNYLYIIVYNQKKKIDKITQAQTDIY